MGSVHHITVATWALYTTNCAHTGLFNLLPARQSAYRQFHSTETAVTAVHNAIVQAIDSKRLSVLVLLDLSSAFDTVDHGILLNILQDRFGVRGHVHRWFKSYLIGRTQVFCTTSGRSDVVNLDCSVPQGSIVGPQQFYAYTEDMSETIERHQWTPLLRWWYTATREHQHRWVAPMSSQIREMCFDDQRLVHQSPSSA